jgi:hypothetical protein
MNNSKIILKLKAFNIFRKIIKKLFIKTTMILIDFNLKILIIKAKIFLIKKFQVIRKILMIKKAQNYS